MTYSQILIVGIESLDMDLIRLTENTINIMKREQNDG